MPVLLAASALLGLAVGSFLNVVIHRVPAGLSVVRPASSCPACGHTIRNRHNVPVVGWLVLRGRCADCDAAISARYPMIEALTASLFVLVTWHAVAHDQLTALPAFLVFVASGVALSAIDLDVMRLPTAIVYPTLVLVLGSFAVASLLTGEVEPLLRSVVAGTVVGAAFLIIAKARRGGMGMGDVRLSIVVGAVLGWVSYPVVVVGLFAAFALGALAGLVLVLLRGAGRRSMLPFGPALVVGAVLALLVGGSVADAYVGLLTTS